ncbi:MAG TPA: cupin-like domain-containing protein [Kofleriaceae bacterium]|nr:cupin-like domain-containing protein [Kofleriaceae bacterium]
MPAPRIQLDPGSFEPWQIQAVRHALSEHPLLQIDALVELGRRQQQRKLVRTHSSAATAGTSFADAPSLHPNRNDAATTLADIERAGAWMSLLNVQADPIYRRLVDEVLDEVRPIVERRDPGMCYRAGWIFVSSPRTVTPFHMDHEHNFILQIRGTKRLYTWDPFDREVVSERAQELFHDQHSRELVVWSEAWRARARVFELEPGLGGYMPSTTPHLVENGDGPSITMSFTYYTDATRQRELLYRGNAQLRRLGLEPRPVGASPGRDRVKHAVIAGYTTARNAVRRALGRGVRDTGVAYAPAQRNHPAAGFDAM